MLSVARHTHRWLSLEHAELSARERLLLPCIMRALPTSDPAVLHLTTVAVQQCAGGPHGLLRRLAVLPDARFIPRGLHDMPATLSPAWSLYKHHVSYCNSVAHDHSVVGWQLPLPNIHVQFVQQKAVASDVSSVCHSSVERETCVVAVDNVEASQWAHRQSAHSLAFASEHGFLGLASWLPHVSPLVITDAKRDHQERMHRLNALGTSHVRDTTLPPWAEARELFSLATLLLELHGVFIASKAPRLFVVPVTPHNAHACALLSVMLAILSPTWYSGQTHHKRNMPSIADAQAVAYGVFTALDLGGHGGAPCINMAAYTSALLCNMHSLPAYTEYKAQGAPSAWAKSSAGYKARIRTELGMCWCSVDAAYQAAHEPFWPAHVVTVPRVADVDLTRDDDDEQLLPPPRVKLEVNIPDDTSDAAPLFAYESPLFDVAAPPMQLNTPVWDANGGDLDFEWNVHPLSPLPSLPRTPPAAAPVVAAPAPVPVVAAPAPVLVAPKPRTPPAPIVVASDPNKRPRTPPVPMQMSTPSPPSKRMRIDARFSDLVAAMKAGDEALARARAAAATLIAAKEVVEDIKRIAQQHEQLTAILPH